MSDPVHESVEILAGLLLKKGLTISFAESCTGGTAAALVTDMPGASEFFAGCAVTYSDDSKEKVLNVSSGTLRRYGAVSAEAAKEMAEGARTAFRTDIAASATGIAGPGGGTDDKPVGTVFIAVADGKRTECKRFALNGSRGGIRDATAKNVIRTVIEFLEGT
jgi:nicotinamide-nucleotide amidase